MVCMDIASNQCGRFAISFVPRRNRNLRRVSLRPCIASNKETLGCPLRVVSRRPASASPGSKFEIRSARHTCGSSTGRSNMQEPRTLPGLYLIRCQSQQIATHRLAASVARASVIRPLNFAHCGSPIWLRRARSRESASAPKMLPSYPTIASVERG